MSREVVVIDGARTAVGTFGGSLKDFAPTKLAASVVREAVTRAGVDPAEVGHLAFGHVVNTEPRDMYLSRVAAIEGGLSKDTPAMNVNRLCGSGLQAIVSAAQSILLGDADVAIGGGAECMSRGPYILPAERWGARMGNGATIDMMVGALTDPFQTVHMGITAENVAKQWGISRDDQDALAVESHKRAARAIEEGRFKAQILGLEIKSRKGPTVFDTDEHVRLDVKPEDMSKLKPVFLKENGTVTAGNASGINDGAAAVVLMDAAAAARQGKKAMARLVSYAHAGVEPHIMGIGPVPASRKALAKAGLRADQMDVVEANEAFAAQALAVCRDLDLDPAKLNPNGSGISLGHPIGATGAIITLKAIHELQRINGRYALVTMCIGGGQGIAAVFERIAH
ncbi:MAG: acetyl-CoA C-acyltransferase [Betaproteobacteria bacterium]|jgi:acetyl-CoA C-acetyltransferase|nr:acetyl-CoA C-acyltransferase family protein [Burkholderiaceae bacterium]NBS80732.1 acetyl-CoA C-acyltransferase [Betaproteobacteria bacterium]NBT97921.1 acetyl-CoA C-acyltransferase [Betaproteobacteria bacterium]NCX01622.1 acetyl-CoA C-acyltransferase [Betaproteobacteria bacterium]NDE30634.1 acetyl-CoA C-acyltransferase [Betaproteobacteria bacterium]